MLLPQYLIVAVMLSVAFYPQFYLNILGNTLNSFVPVSEMAGNINWSGYSGSLANINLYSLLFIGVILVIWIVRSRFVVNLKQEISPTWGCGYVAPNSRMQYTGKSYSKSLGKIFSFLLVEEKKYNELEKGEIFPKTRKYQSFYYDFFETRIFNFITHHLIYTANYFKFIQNGRVQSYVWYGIVFMLSIFLMTFLNILK
jgi:hydrogenase-4 component B